MSLRKLYTAIGPMDAHFLRNLLEQQGIEATVMGESLAAARGDLPLTPDTLPSVWVYEEDMERALPVAQEYILRHVRQDEPRPLASEPWKCPSCGESIEPQFDECWKCGHQRPADAT